VAAAVTYRLVVSASLQFVM